MLLRAWPCESMALWPSLVLLLDTHDRLCIWKGVEAAAKLEGRSPCHAGEQARRERLVATKV